MVQLPQLQGLNISNALSHFTQGRELARGRRRDNALSQFALPALTGDDATRQNALAQLASGGAADVALQLGQFDMESRAARAAAQREQDNFERQLAVDQQRADFATDIGIQTQLRAAGRPTTSVTVEACGDSEFFKSLGRLQAENFDELQHAARGARGTLETFAAMEELMEDDNFFSGAGAESLTELLKLARFVGVETDVSSIEAFNSLSKDAMLKNIGGSLGVGVSNADVSIIQSTVPKIENTPEGNRRLIEIQGLLALRKIQMAQLAEQYVTENRSMFGFDGFLEEWAKTQPMFGDPVDVQTEEDVQALFSGTLYRDPEGNIFRKR